MRVRGRRRCQDCDATWSYFETGEPACPACGSLRSVGRTEERTLHTDGPSALDLSAARAALEEQPLRAAAAAAERAARDYRRGRGFVHAGALQPLDDTVLAAAELRAVAGELRRGLAPEAAVEAHFLALLAGADAGERPEEVPEPLQSARGLAAAGVVGDYRRDLASWLDARSARPAPAVRALLDRLRTHERRIEAVDGAVPPADTASLVAAARALGEHLRTGDDTALDRARAALDGLEADAR